MRICVMMALFGAGQQSALEGMQESSCPGYMIRELHVPISQIVFM